jgi:hypothetical protein|tara:strand:+ start:4988 stop:5167 length:180 start_codon:yes stop_codon:yes gene_type:complete
MEHAEKLGDFSGRLPFLDASLSGNNAPIEDITTVKINSFPLFFANELSVSERPELNDLL